MQETNSSSKVSLFQKVSIAVFSTRPLLYPEEKRVRAASYSVCLGGLLVVSLT